MTYINRIVGLAPNRREAPPYLELSLGATVLYALRWQAIGIVGLACHIVLVKELGPFCIVLGIAGLAWLAFQKTLPAFIVFLQIIIYQNVLISVFSPGMHHDSYVALSGSAFVSAVVVAGIFAIQILGSGDGRSKRLSKYTIAAILVALMYLALGAVTTSPVGAIISFRQVSAMLFSILIGLRIGQSWGYRTAVTCFLLALFISLVPTTLEIADPVWYLDIVNAKDFTNLKTSGLRADGYAFDVHSVIEAQTSAWFNSPLVSIGNESFRFGGPNMHSISYAYMLSIGELMLISLGRYELLPVLLIFSYNIGVKGPTVLFAISILLYLLWRITGSKRMLVITALTFSAFYVIYGVQTGIAIGDFHALGFMGGVYGFLANPLGHGLGAGGNFTVEVSTAYWEKMQHAGAADVGLESAAGVMLYQMGIGCVAVYAAVIALLRAAPIGTAQRGRAALTDLLFIGLWIGLINGVFQEEAYSPYAVGMLTLFCSILVANGRRRQLFSQWLPS